MYAALSGLKMPLYIFESNNSSIFDFLNVKNR